MAIYSNSIKNLNTQIKRVALPRNDSIDNKIGFGSLVFLFTDNIGDSIRMINNNEQCYHDNKYRYFFYNLHYRGTIVGRRYNIKDFEERKKIYNRIIKETQISPHPLSPLNTTPNRNCYFDMSKYFEIYKFMTKKFTPTRKVTIFWDFFKSVWLSEQTSTYPEKTVLINADMYTKFSGGVKECIDNPLFMLYYTMYKYFDLIKDLDINFIIYCKKTVLRVNPSLCDEKSYVIFKRELQKVFSRKTELDSLDENDINDDEQKELLKDNLNKRYNFTGNEIEEDEVTSLTDKSSDKDIFNDKIDNKISEKIDSVKNDVSKIIPKESSFSKEVTDAIQTQSEIELDNDKEIIENMYKMMQKEKVPSKPLSTARDAELRKRQEELKIGSVTFKEINSMNASKRLIPKKNISKSIKNINENVKTVKFANINKDYIENVLPEDIAKVFTSLNSKSSKFYVIKYDVKDSSNELNYKDTYTVVLEDEIKQRHTITVDIPKFLDNKFMYLGGNKKIINKQNFLFPVVKTAPDTVQIVTNYNKMFIRRVGTKSISSVERIMKTISNNDEAEKYFVVGNNSAVNRSFVTTIEYDEFGKVLTKFITDRCTVFFNQQDAINYADSKNIDIPENHIFVGIKDKNNIFIDINTQLTTEGESICDLIVSELPDSIRKEFEKTRSTKKLMYNTVTIMAQSIPFIVLLLYWEGITSVFKKIGIKYYFSTKFPQSLKNNESVIRFKDSYFVYEEDLATSLLMNGIKVLDTENYNMEEYNTPEPFLEYFRKVYGKVAIINALSNAYDFTIDPITLEILEDINLPTDLVELCIYASNLLADESYTIENSQTLSRVRSTEIIPAILYNEISKSYINYKNYAGKHKLTIPKDCVIKQLLALQTVEDYSTLNPVVELEKDRAITSKGFRGINVDRAYTEEKRSYDDSMIGIIAMSTSPDGNCGINRFLTLEPNITSARGYVDIKSDKKEELKDVNLFSPAELLYPLGNTRDDSVRTAMACKQSKHVIPVDNSIPALISNGVDEAIKFNLSSDFVVNADEDGTVIDYNVNSKIMMVEYKSGKHRAIDLSPHIVKNGGGGFFLSNQLQTKLKVGDKFNKDDTLAWHKDFFKDDGFNGIRMNVGVLEKVALASSYD